MTRPTGMLLTGLVAVMASSGCGNLVGTSGTEAGPVLLLALTDDGAEGRLGRLDLSSGQVTWRTDGLPRLISATLIEEQDRLLLTGYRRLPERTDVLLETKIGDFEVTWRRDVDRLTIRDGLPDSLEVSILSTDMASRDGRRMLLFGRDPTRDIGPPGTTGSPGLAFVDTETGGIVDFFAPFWGRSSTAFASVPPSRIYPEGAAVVGGARTWEVEPTSGRIFVLNWQSSALADSITLTRGVDDQYGGIVSLVAGPEGRFVYILTLTDIVKYDLIRGQISRTVSLPPSIRSGVTARFMISGDGEELYLGTPTRTWQSPSPLLHVLGSNLALREPIDLSDVTIDGSAPIAVGPVATRGDSLFILSGTHGATIDRSQRPAVTVVDRSTGSVLEVYPLGEFGSPLAVIPVD